MSPWMLEAVGLSAAVLTTLCWLPQAAKIIRSKETGGLSLVTQATFSLGVAIWLAYGILLGSLSIVLANGATLGLSLVILALKIRYG